MIQYNRINYGKEKNNKLWKIYVFCLLLPIFGHVVRKVIPNNPVFIEGLPLAILFFVYLYLFKNVRNAPRNIVTPLMVLITINVIYALVGVIDHPMTASSAVVVRSVPLLMSAIAFKTIRGKEDLQRILPCLGYLAVLLTPISVYVAIYGDKHLPIILRPIETVSSAGLTELKGLFYTATAIFTTPTQLGYYGYTVLILTMAASATVENRQVRKVNLFYIASLILIYLSGRRILIYSSLTLLSISFINQKKKYNTILVALVVVFTVLWFNDNTKILGKTNVNRLNYLVKEDAKDKRLLDSIDWRIRKYAIKNTFNQVLSTPLGTYLGAYGPERRAFSDNKSHVTEMGWSVESGATLLAGEMGWVGLIGMPIIILYILYQCFKMSHKKRNKRAIRLLSISLCLFYLNFLLKDSMFLSGSQVQINLLWSIPGLCASLAKE